MPTGSELFVRSLKSQGIDRIFTLVGDHLNDVLQVAAREGMSIFDTRHESAAVHMADGWTRLTRKPAVSLVTGAPGHTNSITGIATADATAVPMLAVSGMSDSNARDRFAFQDMDQLSLVRGITKYAAVPARSGQIPFHVKRAFLEMLRDRPGVAHLSIPVDLFTENCKSHAPVPNERIEPARSAPASADIDRIVDLLSTAQRPAVIAGSGAYWSGADAELAAFVENARVPLFTANLARGMVSDDHALCFGYADATINRGAENALRQADLIVVAGKRLDYGVRMGGPQLFAPDAKTVQIDVCGMELGLNRQLEVGVPADVRTALAALNEALAGRPAPDRSDWLDEVQRGCDAYAAEVAAIVARPRDPMHSLHAYQALRDKLPPDATICWDGGDFVHWGRYLLKARHAGRWMRLGSLAGLGVALPVGLSAQILRPDSRTVVVTGDGSLGFYVGELDTAVRYGLPLVVIVGNDGGWGIERELQKAFYPDADTVACELRSTRYDLVMKGFGGDGAHVTSPDQLEDAFDRAFRSEKPFLVNIEIAGAGSPFTQYQIDKRAK
ncbi:MAG: thiamine pyrophosphate-binding protein [Bryobacterales bacterium]|nr:thiamine pyrophosphate-binding protein [Bryobacterales bacterium]